MVLVSLSAFLNNGISANCLSRPAIVGSCSTSSKTILVAMKADGYNVVSSPHCNSQVVPKVDPIGRVNSVT